MTTLRTVQRNEVHPSHQVAETEEPSLDVILESVARMFCPVCKQKMNTSGVKAFSTGRCPSCGENVVVHGRIGAYRVLRVLGQGGMGVVYEGFDEGLGRKVAIKVTQVDVTQNKEMLATFQREAQVVARLNHPNVVQVYAFGEEKGHPYLVMELLSSGSLMDLIKETEPIGEAFLMGVAFEIAEGLNAAQEAGLLHGDIKPENILFDEKMHAKLVDFGIAAMQVSKDSHEVWGTPFYIAPEKVLERKSNHKGDIYSLGATLYHAVAKNPPFNGTDPTVVIRAAIDGKAEPLSKVRPDINPEVEAIINRMMEKDTALRYPNYKSIMSDVKKYISTVPRERLRRTSRIVVGGRSSTRKILVQGKVPSPSSMLTGTLLLDVTESVKKNRILGIRATTVGLATALVLLIVGVFFCKVKCEREEQKMIAAQAWGLDKKYATMFRSMTKALSKVEAISEEAQEGIKKLQAQLAKTKTPDQGVQNPNEELEAYKKRFQALVLEAVDVRNQAEMCKLGPLTRESVEQGYLTVLKSGLEKQTSYTLAMKAKGEEAERLLVELKDKGAALVSADKARRDLAQQIRIPKLVKELARGSGVDFTTLTFMGMKELHDVRMNEKDLLILAVWSSNPEVECGAEVNTLAVTRREGGRVFIAKPGGAVSLMGLSTLSQFPAIDAIADSQVGNKSNEWVVASMPNISFKKSLTKDMMVYQVAGTPESKTGEKRLYASALVFEARHRGTYSLDGQMVLQAPNETAKVSWMIWVARSE